MSRPRDLLKNTYSKQSHTVTTYKGILTSNDICALKNASSPNLVRAAVRSGRLTFISSSSLHWEPWVVTLKQNLSPLLTCIFKWNHCHDLKILSKGIKRSN